MNSRTTRRFRRAFRELPKRIQDQAREAYRLFQQDPQHPGLRFKKVHAALPVYAVRVSVDYRAVGVLRDNGMVWFWIGSHAEYDRVLNML